MRYTILLKIASIKCPKRYKGSLPIKLPLIILKMKLYETEKQKKNRVLIKVL